MPHTEHNVIELLKPIVLYKDYCEPKYFNTGTLLRVLLKAPRSLLVADDQAFNFTVSLDDENIVWKMI